MWTLVYAFVVAGSVQQFYVTDFETKEACEFYAEEVLSEKLVGVDNEEYKWICL